jgi:hypothetical protein
MNELEMYIYLAFRPDCVFSPEFTRSLLTPNAGNLPFIALETQSSYKITDPRELQRYYSSMSFCKM